jgi:hypothetical protein
MEASIKRVSIEGTGKSTIIIPEQLYDPLLVLFKGKLHLNDWWVITAIGILSATGLLSWHLISTLISL